MKKWYKRPWFLVFLVLGILGAGGGYAVFRSRSQTAGGQVAVQVVPVEKGDLVTRVQAPAAVAAADEKEYRAAFDTLAVHLEVKAGDRVQKGQLLAVLDRSAQEAVVRREQAALANAGLQLGLLRLKQELAPQQHAVKLAAARESMAEAEDTLQRSLRTLDTRTANARARVQDAQASLALAEAQAPQVTREQVQGAYQRLQEARDAVEQDPADAGAQAGLTRAEQEYRDLNARLRTAGEQQRQQVARAELSLRQAQDELAELDPETAPDVRQARLKLVQAQRSLDTAHWEIRQDSFLPEQVASQELAVRSAEQSLADHEARLKRAELRAEAGGIVLSVPAREGNPVKQDGLVLVVGRLDEVKLTARVDESDIATVQPGMKLRARSGSSPDRVFEGQVTLIAPESSTYRTGQGATGAAGFQNQGAAVTFPVDALVTNRENRLRPGMSVDTEIDTGSRPGAVSVGVEAVLDKPGPTVQKYVWVLTGDTVEERPVKVGVRADTRLEILAGLSAGEQVVSGPFSVLRTLRPGQKVLVAAPGDAPGPGGPGAGPQGGIRP